MSVDLTAHGVHAPVLHNPAPARLVELALAHEPGSLLTDTGALVAYSGEKTGRSPKDKRIVDEPGSAAEVDWGAVNVALPESSFDLLFTRAAAFLSAQSRLFVIDGFAGWDPAHRIKVRVIASRAYHALFMQNMLVRPTPAELADFGTPDLTIWNAGAHTADPSLPGVGGPTCVALHPSRGQLVILGTQYAGEMKKGVFTVMHHRMPRKGLLSMHCSANASADTGDTTLFFGLSGTGKTTLSADPRRRLIGDDEHVWTDDGIFNIEGGCYAKAIRLSPATEPEIHAAIRFGAVLENVAVDPISRQVDYADDHLTENTRCSYPLSHIPGAVTPALGRAPRHVVFLTCDATGVLPPVARLGTAQAMLHFLSGYTAKVAGTEMGVREPQATFSACFGAPFLVWHPQVYARLLARRLAESSARVWLVNTGWSGGPPGVGHRMPIPVSRAILDAIHAGALDASPVRIDPIFRFDVPIEIPGVPAALMHPRSTWPSPAAYDAAAARLARLFIDNLARFGDAIDPEVRAALPVVPA